MIKKHLQTAQNLSQKTDIERFVNGCWLDEKERKQLNKTRTEISSHEKVLLRESTRLKEQRSVEKTVASLINIVQKDGLLSFFFIQIVKNANV